MQAFQRYRDLSGYLKLKLGAKVFKVSLDAVTSCPNIDGTLAKGGCTFCNDAAFSPTLLGKRGRPISEQLEHGMAYIRKRHQNAKAIAYFQSFTSTYGSLEILGEKFWAALNHPDILGLAVSTRPDCLNEEWCRFFAGLAEKKLFWLELGLQSSSNRSLMAVNRWHTASQFVQALWMAKQYGLSVCSHLVFGLPGESDSEMLESVQFLASLPMDGIKFHNLHVVKGTQLAETFKRGDYKPLSLERYASLTAQSLSLLPPHIVVHRLNAHAPRHLTLAPDWSVNKLAIFNAVHKTLEAQNLWQGKKLGYSLEVLETFRGTDDFQIPLSLTALEQNGFHLFQTGLSG